MNAPDTPPMLDHLRALRRRWPLILLITLLTGLAALAVSLSGQKQYDTSAQLVLRGQEPVDALLNPGAASPSNDPERELNTEAELIKVGGTARLVRQQLGLVRSVDELLEQVTTETSSSSNIVTVTVRDPDRRTAARIANGFADGYVANRLRASRARYEQAARLAFNQYSALLPDDQATPQGSELLSRARRLRIAAGLQTGDAQVVRRAGVPGEPSRPRPVLSTALGLMLGLLLGVVVALALELLDRRFRDEEAVEAFFKLPILASIPRPERRGPGGHLHGEAYGLLAASLRYSTLRGRPNALMITSAAPGEGKTTVTLGLAGALANLGLRVIAIEADLRRPTFAFQAALGPSAGVTGVLSGAADLAEELVWVDPVSMTAVNPLRADDDVAFGVLPCGPLPTNPLRTLSDPAFGALIAEARSMADVVLIDTPPIGTVNDPAPVAAACDAVAIVVRLNKSTKDASTRALRVLGGIDVRVAGVVLTGAQSPGDYAYYPTMAPDPPELVVDYQPR